MMKKTKGLLCVLLMIFMTTGLLPLHVQAAGSFPPIRDTNTDGTNLFVMGDCRAVAIFSVCKLKGAAIAQGAGHYRKKWPAGYVIDSKAQMALLNKSVVKRLKQTGKATVVIMATINIGSHARSNCNPAVDSQLRPAKIAAGWSASYKGKRVRPTVYATSLIPERGTSPAKYNKCLKKYLKKSAYRSIKYLGVSAKGGYAGDGCHLSNSGAKAVWKTMYEADKRAQVQYK